MRALYKLSVLFFLLPLISVAQSNYKPGYVVTLKGDTIHGFIDYREWDKNPVQVVFKTKLNENKNKEFTVQNAKAFAITGLEYYERYVVNVSQDPIDITTIGTKIDTSSKNDTVFLKVINKGSYTALFSYRDDIKFRFYLLETGKKLPQELAYHAYYNSDESSSVKYVSRYRTQLQNVAQKNHVTDKELEKMISQSRYSEEDLRKIVSKINGNSSSQAALQSSFGTRWFAGFSVTYNNAKPGGSIDAPADNSIFPKLSAGLDFMPNKNTQQFILRAELALTANRYSFSSSGLNSSYKSTLNQYTVSIVPQFIFNIYNTENLKWFIDGGISFNLSSYGNYAFTYYFDNISSVVLKNYPPLSKAWVSIPIKTGILLNKKVEIFVAYSPAANLSTDPDASIEITSYQAGINYLFGSK